MESLDKKTEAVLKTINSISCGRFRVITYEELAYNADDVLKETTEDARAAVGFLGEKGYADLKYADKNECFICTTSKGLSYFDDMRRELIERGYRRLERKRTFILCALGSALGSLLGGGILLGMLALFGAIKC